MPGVPVLLLTGPPGAGKSTVARLADHFDMAVCLESDWFWTTIVRGHVRPWLPEADAQNRAVLRSWAAAAGEMSAAGYTVVVDGPII